MVQNGTVPYTYLWNFGDEQESNLNYPVHSYAENGDYLVTLTGKHSAFWSARRDSKPGVAIAPECAAHYFEGKHSGFWSP